MTDYPSDTTQITTPGPDGDGVILHLPEITYLDTQVWSVDIGLTPGRLAELRTALDEAAARQATGQADTTPTRCPDWPNCNHPFMLDGCTCRPWTRQTTPARYLEPGDSIEMIGGWERGTDCPHHAPAPVVGQPAAAPDTDAREARAQLFHFAVTRDMAAEEMADRLLNEHRAAVLNEAADFVAGPHPDDCGCGGCAECATHRAARLLRRRAAGEAR